MEWLFRLFSTFFDIFFGLFSLTFSISSDNFTYFLCCLLINILSTLFQVLPTFSCRLFDILINSFFWLHSSCLFSLIFSFLIFSFNILSNVFSTLFNISSSLLNVLFCLMSFLFCLWSCHFVYFLFGSIINFMWNLFYFLPSLWKSGSDTFNDSGLFINGFFSLLFSLLPLFLCFMFHLFSSFFNILFFLMSFGFHFFHSNFNISCDISCCLLDIFSSKFKARVRSDDIKAFLWIFWWEGCIHTESFDNNFEILLMFVNVSFEVDLFDITHIDSFVNRKREIVLEYLDFVRKDSDRGIFVKTSFLWHFE